jgi:transposase-like protein
MNEKSRQWLEAFLRFETDIHAKVNCPDCGNHFLIVKDVPFSSEHKLERWLICEGCGKFNTVIKASS